MKIYREWISSDPHNVEELTQNKKRRRWSKIFQGKDIVVIMRMRLLEQLNYLYGYQAIQKP